MAAVQEWNCYYVSQVKKGGLSFVAMTLYCFEEPYKFHYEKGLNQNFLGYDIYGQPHAKKTLKQLKKVILTNLKPFMLKIVDSPTIDFVHT